MAQICADNRQIYGPALIRAYELEKDCAIYPRVIVDPDLLAQFPTNLLLRSEINPLEMETEYIASLIRRGEDHFWLVT